MHKKLEHEAETRSKLKSIAFMEGLAGSFLNITRSNQERTMKLQFFFFNIIPISQFVLPLGFRV